MFSFIPKFSLQSSRKKLEKKKTIHQIAFSFQSLLQQLQPSTSFFVTFTPTLTPDKKKKKRKERSQQEKRQSFSCSHKTAAACWPCQRQRESGRAELWLCRETKKRNPDIWWPHVAYLQGLLLILFFLDIFQMLIQNWKFKNYFYDSILNFHACFHPHSPQYHYWMDIRLSNIALHYSREPLPGRT